MKVREVGTNSGALSSPLVDDEIEDEFNENGHEGGHADRPSRDTKRIMAVERKVGKKGNHSKSHTPYI